MPPCRSPTAFILLRSTPIVTRVWAISDATGSGSHPYIFCAACSAGSSPERPSGMYFSIAGLRAEMAARVCATFRSGSRVAPRTRRPRAAVAAQRQPAAGAPGADRRQPPDPRGPRHHAGGAVEPHPLDRGRQRVVILPLHPVGLEQCEVEVEAAALDLLRLRPRRPGNRRHPRRRAHALLRAAVDRVEPPAGDVERMAAERRHRIHQDQRADRDDRHGDRPARDRAYVRRRATIDECRTDPPTGSHESRSSSCTTSCSQRARSHDQPGATSRDRSMGNKKTRWRIIVILQSPGEAIRRLTPSYTGSPSQMCSGASKDGMESTWTSTARRAIARSSRHPLSPRRGCGRNGRRAARQTVRPGRRSSSGTCGAQARRCSGSGS